MSVPPTEDKVSTSKGDKKITSQVQDWTEKYRPRKLDHVVGNKKAKEELREWAKEWKKGKPKKKAVILAGKPGIGKTSSAIALANEMGWDSIEVNASDERNKDAIKDVVGRSAVDDTFSENGEFIPYKSGSRKLLIVDEADNIFGKKDKGGVGEITNTIKKTEQPMVLIVNDYYDLRRRSRVLSRICKKIEFETVNNGEIEELLKRICDEEGKNYRMMALKSIAERSDGDVRSAVRDLESVAVGRNVIKREHLSSLGSRNREAEIFPTLKTILQGKDPIEAKESIRDLNEEPRDLLLWLDENLPREYTEPRDRWKGFYMLSRADVYLGRIFGSQHYGFWRYANDLMAGGVSVSKRKPHNKWTKYAFPTWLKQMSSSKGKRSIQRRISHKIAEDNHATTRRVKSDILPFFEHLFKNRKEFRERMTKELELEKSEVAFLLDEDVDAVRVEELFKEEVEEEIIEKEKEAEEDEGDEEKKDKKEEDKEQQKSLMEF